MKARRSPSVAVFTERGFRAREVFDHRVVTIAKQYDDLLADFQARGLTMEALSRGSFRQLNVYATDVDRFPDELFTSPAVNWHRQGFGIKGLVATASLYLPGDGSIMIDKLQSDVCQQVRRDPALHREYGSRIENCFGAWYKLAWNAVLDFAVQRAIDTVWWPTAAGIVSNLRPDLDPALFERVYDGVSNRYRCVRTPLHRIEWWRMTVADNCDRIVSLLEEADTPRIVPKVICVFHDIEENVDTPVSAESCRDALTRMLAVERDLGVRATYNVVGTLLREAVPPITAQGHHALGFHSWNHRIGDLSQLKRCREANLKVRGYRPPRSILTPELTDYRLSYHNFEWLLNAAGTLSSSDCRLENGIVKIPVHLDDYPLATGAMQYPEWRARLLRMVDERAFVAVGLHDCYAAHWIDEYADLLMELGRRGDMWTCDDVSAEVFLHGDGTSAATPRSTTRVDQEVWRRFLEASRRSPARGDLTSDREHRPTDGAG